MFCPSCGNPISQYMRFCSKCGRPLTPEPVPTEAAPGLKAETEMPLPEPPPLSEQPPADSPVFTPEPARLDVAPTQESFSQEPRLQTSRPQEPAADPFIWYTPASVRSSAAAQSSAPGTRIQNPYDRPTYQPGYHNRGKRRAWLIVLLSLLLVLVLIVAALFTYSYFAHYSGVSSMGQGYSSPSALITAYFKAFETGDEDAVAGMLPKPVQDYFHSQGDSNGDIVYNIDDWSDGYGTGVNFWEISGQSAYRVGDYNFSEYGISNRVVSSFVDFSCDITFEGYDSSGSDYTMDFDLVQIGGSWYLIQVW